MNREKAITYSLLAHIRNTATLINGPLDIFVPLIKRAISKMNNDGIFSGESISEINTYSKSLYDIDFPIPVLRSILIIISSEVSEDEHGAFILNNDNSFSIANYTFTEFDESVRKRKTEIIKLEELFQDFCEKSKLEIQDSTSIFKFLERNKLSLSKYLSNTEVANGENYLVEVQFINYFKNIPTIYELLKSLYLGSILSEYIEFIPSNVEMNVELLLDTNFIISLLDLNTPESTHTCNTLVSITKEQGYKLSILQETIEEIKFLLGRKAEGLNKSFLVKNIYEEDIYNACERRGLTKMDLERIIDNIEVKILEYGIEKVLNSDQLRKDALASVDYEYYKGRRTANISAQHDALASYYVKEKRGHKKIKEFTDVSCWFVNNAISRGFGKNSYEKTFQPVIIKADDLLSILWLSNPQVSKLIPSEEMADIGLSSLVSLTFSESLPKTSIIREFEDNIQKYAKEDISSKDIIRVATRIADKQLIDVEELNQLADEDQELFVQRLEEEAAKQEEIEAVRTEALSEIVEKFKGEIEKLEEIKQTRAEKDKVMKALEEKDNTNQGMISDLSTKLEASEKALSKTKLDESVKAWQLKSRILFLIALTIFLPAVLYILLDDPSILNNHYMKVIGVIISVFFGFSIKLLYDRHFNHSNIENYKKSFE